MEGQPAAVRSARGRRAARHRRAHRVRAPAGHRPERRRGEAGGAGPLAGAGAARAAARRAPHRARPPAARPPGRRAGGDPARRRRTTSLIVTHDPAEAATVADRVVRMDELGRVEIVDLTSGETHPLRAAILRTGTPSHDVVWAGDERAGHGAPRRPGRRSPGGHLDLDADRGRGDPAARDGRRRRSAGPRDRRRTARRRARAGRRRRRDGGVGQRQGQRAGLLPAPRVRDRRRRVRHARHRTPPPQDPTRSASASS